MLISSTNPVRYLAVEKIGLIKKPEPASDSAKLHNNKKEGTDLHHMKQQGHLVTCSNLRCKYRKTNGECEWIHLFLDDTGKCSHFIMDGPPEVGYDAGFRRDACVPASGLKPSKD